MCFDYSSDAIRRLFGGYDPTLHSTVVKNQRREKKKRMRQTLRNPTQRGFVVWGWQGAVSICLVFTGSLSQPRLKMLRDVNVGRYQGLFRPRGWPPGQGWGGGEVWRWSWLNTLHVGVGRPVPTTSMTTVPLPSLGLSHSLSGLQPMP